MIHIKIVFEYPLDFVHFYVYKFSSLSSQKICHYSYLSTKLFSFSFKKTRNKVTVLKKITALLSYSSYATIQFSSVQSLRCVWLFATPWTAARQASLSITNSQSPPKPMSIKLVMPSSHLILCHPLLLLSPILPSIRVFPSESSVCMRWPKFTYLTFFLVS